LLQLIFEIASRNLIFLWLSVEAAPVTVNLKAGCLFLRHYILESDGRAALGEPESSEYAEAEAEGDGQVEFRRGVPEQGDSEKDQYCRFYYWVRA
jgi:hypothetical protein